MTVQGIKVILMLNHNKITVKVGERHIHRLVIRPGKDHGSISGCVHSSAIFVDKFDTGMRIPFSILRGSIAIGGIDKGIIRRMDRALEEEVPVGNAEVSGRWVAGD